MRLPLTSLSLTVLLFASCLKNESTDPEIIIEPPMPVEVKLDSIMTGSLYNVTVGEDAEEVYRGLQGFSNAKGKIEYLGITGTHNATLSDLKDRIPLYNSLLLDRKPSLPQGGQIYFNNNEIVSIYHRDGKKVSSWPWDAADPLRVGDPVTVIYDKLIKLQKDPSYARMFDYIGMFEKNMNKPFDAFQNRSTLWQFSIAEDDNNFIRVDLVFENAKLVKIRSRHERYL